MEAIAIRPIRVKTTGKEYRPGERVEAEPEKLLQWSEKGLVRIVDETRGGEIVRFNSPLFGELEGIILEMEEKTFRLIHPLTGEVVSLSNEWLISMEERSAILEYEANFPRKEADAWARREFFGLFRKGETDRADPVLSRDSPGLQIRFPESKIKPPD